MLDVLLFFVFVFAFFFVLYQTISHYLFDNGV